jgi:SAM-dependent methyltransferase
MPDDGYNTFQQAPHPMLPLPSLEEGERQAFAKSLKGYIQKNILPGLEPTFRARAAKRFLAREGRAPANRHDIRRAMADEPYFQAYAAVNRISQELLWTSVIDSIERQYEALQGTARALKGTIGACSVDRAFTPPAYVTGLDIHCMPGGYAQATGDDIDFAAGALYDRGVYLYAMGYAGPFNDDKGRSVVNYIKRNLPGFVPRRILDMGCSVGHATLPYKEQFPDAEVIGIDVTEPLVTYAHLRAAGLGVDVRFEQRNAEATGYPDASFDLVVSHILLHETSGRALPAILQECHRLLKPGGYMIHADLPPFDKMNEFMQFIMDNETYYNNEPFWGAMRELDLVALSAEAGFPRESVRFDTAPMAIREFAGRAKVYDGGIVKTLAERKFTAGEYAPGAGWEVLIARREFAS